MKYFSVIFTVVLLITYFCTLTAQINWTKYDDPATPNIPFADSDPVLFPGSFGEWDHDFVSIPAVLFDDSTYHMWYCNAVNQNLERVGYATSPDGISWTKYDDPTTPNHPYAESDPVLNPGPPGSWDSEGVGGPSVLLIGNTYHMWYSGGGAIGHATSTDGIDWDKDTLNPVLIKGPVGSWDYGWVLGPRIVFDGQIYHMWYSAWDGVHGLERVRIGHATAPHPDSTWIKDPFNPVLSRGLSTSWDYRRVEAPGVIFDDTTFYMFYSGGEYWQWRIGYAWTTNPNGPNWTKYSDNPVLEWGPSADWDDYGVAYCAVIFDTVSDVFKMWYSGADALWSNHIGYATAPVVLQVPQDYTTIQSAIDAASDGNIVLVDEGTYYENINFKGKAITVASRFLVDEDTSHISNTIINGSQPSHPDSGSVVTFSFNCDTTSVLMGFTITGGIGKRYTDPWGNTFRQGAGVDVLLSGAKIVSNKIINNHIPNNISYQAFGAGICVFGMFDEYVIIDDNEICNNTTTSTSHTYGAGVSMGTSGTIHFRNNSVYENSNTASGTRIALGGGLYVWGGNFGGATFNGDIYISGNIIKGNMVSPGTGILVPQGGGGLYIDLCSPRVENNIIAENQAPKGAGILVCGKHRGGMSGLAYPILINNTIAYNTATQDGGGLYSLGDPVNAVHTKVMNSILWGNNAPGEPEIQYTGPISVVYSDIAGGFLGINNMSKEPMLRGENYRLSDSSSCIGAGIDSIQISGTWYHCPPICYLGHSRPFPSGSMPDMGACESRLDSPVVALETLFADYIPKTYDLRQNYPNPFNPSTTIEFDLPKTSDVVLKVFNILGEEVAILVSDKLSSGSYSYDWDAGNRASGVYLYRLQAGDYIETRKMVLMR